MELAKIAHCLKLEALLYEAPSPPPTPQCLDPQYVSGRDWILSMCTCGVACLTFLLRLGEMEREFPSTDLTDCIPEVFFSFLPRVTLCPSRGAARAVVIKQGEF